LRCEEDGVCGVSRLGCEGDRVRGGRCRVYSIEERELDTNIDTAAADSAHENAYSAP